MKPQKPERIDAMKEVELRPDDAEEERREMRTVSKTSARNFTLSRIDGSKYMDNPAQTI